MTEIVTNAFAASNLPLLSFSLRNNVDWSASFLVRGVDLTNVALRMMLQPVDGDVIVLDASTQDGRIVFTDPPNGKFTLVVNATDMAGVPAGTYRGDLL